jgi:hypothetical protein
MLSDLTKIFLTSALTIIGGITIYVAGQIIARFFIDPLHESGSKAGEIYREYRPGCWEETANVDYDVQAAFGVATFKYVIRPSCHLSTVWIIA